jgi:hypothetical protein
MSELKHYGVKGMRWGVRKDRVGRARSAAKQDTKDNKSKVHVERVIHVPIGRKKKVSKMTTDELRARIERLELEKRVRDLESGKPAQQVQKGKTFTSRMMERSGEIFVSTMVTAAATVIANRMIKERFGQPLPPPPPGTRRG